MVERSQRRVRLPLRQALSLLRFRNVRFRCPRMDRMSPLPLQPRLRCPPLHVCLLGLQWRNLIRLRIRLAISLLLFLRRLCRALRLPLTVVVESSSSPVSPAEAPPVSPALQSVTDRSNRILSTVVQAARGLTDNENLIHFPCVDRDRLPEWIADLEEARRSLTRFITRLREEVSDGTPTAALED